MRKSGLNMKRVQTSGCPGGCDVWTRKFIMGGWEDPKDKTYFNAIMKQLSIFGNVSVKIM
jgi:hypothetical protein